MNTPVPTSFGSRFRRLAGRAALVTVAAVLGAACVPRTTAEIALTYEAAAQFNNTTWEVDLYRNGALQCGKSGFYSFLVVEPGDDPGGEAPLWVYLHGGGVGYYDQGGVYRATRYATEDSWNHEEGFNQLWVEQVLDNVLYQDGTVKDTTLFRRVAEGYRILVVSMCDHDLYSGTGSPYPNNPRGGQVNGLQATMAAVDYTVANYPTTHVFAHGTSAGSVGAFSLATAYAREGVALTGVVADSYIITDRLFELFDTYGGHPSFPFEADFDPEAAIDKIGSFADPRAGTDPESRIRNGFTAVPSLFLGGKNDTFCAGPLPPISPGLNNCDWTFDGLRQAIADQPDSPHRLRILEQTGHVPTNEPGPVNDLVDDFVDEVLARNPAPPFGG